MAASALAQAAALEERIAASMAAHRPMAPEVLAVAAALEALPRPRGVAAGARVLAVDLDADVVSWSDGRVAPLFPIEYA